MSRLPSLTASRSARLATLAVLAVACQRRESPDARMGFALDPDEAWSYATHPVIPLDGSALRDITARVLQATGRFAPAAMPPESPEAGRLAARVYAQILSADLTPSGDAGQESIAHVEVRFQFVPPLSDEASALVVLVHGSGRGTPEEASRAAFAAAVGQGIEEVSTELHGREQSDDELIAELHGADQDRARIALERLVARRHWAAFGPLVDDLHGSDDGAAVRALSSLVALGDPRAVRPIIDEAERRNLAFRLEALYALGSMGGEEAEAYLFTLTSDPDARVRGAAVEALAVARRRAAGTADSGPRRVRSGPHADERDR